MSSWKGPSGVKSTRKKCLFIKSRNKGWKRTTWSWSKITIMIAVILMIVKTLMLGGWRWQPEPRLFATFSPHFCAQSLCSPVFSLCCLYHFLFVYCSAIECSTVDVAKEPQRILYMLQKGVEYVQETRRRHLFVSFSPLEEQLFGS